MLARQGPLKILRVTRHIPFLLQEALTNCEEPRAGPLWQGLKKQANEVRVGNVLDLGGGRLWQVSKAEHTQGHGRQLGNVQLELRDLRSRTKQHERRRPYDMVEIVRLEGRPFQFLYAEGEGRRLCLMDAETYEQMTVDRTLFGEQAKFLAEGMEVTVNMADGEAITGELPQTVTVEVAQTAAYARGNSAGPGLKEATLENGTTVMVPPYVASGERISVDTRDGSFVRRAN